MKKCGSPDCVCAHDEIGHPEYPAYGFDNVHPGRVMVRQRKAGADSRSETGRRPTILQRFLTRARKAI